MTSFEELRLRPQSRAALAAMAISSPTPIQTAALPEMLAGRDVIGQARTGSGKTIAFALPIVERTDERRREVQALVLAPTRELAAQVAGVVRELAHGRDLKVLLLVGGMTVGPQRQALRHGVHVVVGTPGRVLDHINQGNLSLDRLRVLVLDEADEMLDRGFAPDVERIIATTNQDRQTALFSATVPEWVGAMVAKHLRSPISAKVDAQSAPVENVTHAVYDVPAGGKLAALRTLLDARGASSLLVFGRTKHGVRKLAKQLEAAGYPVGALQGNLSQNARDRVMAEFRSGATPILIATNVAARGLDVDHVAQVINYELPETADLLTHRVGRTGRMGRSGEAITLLTPDDEVAWKKLLRELRRHPVRRPWRGRHEGDDVPAMQQAPEPRAVHHGRREPAAHTWQPVRAVSPPARGRDPRRESARAAHSPPRQAAARTPMRAAPTTAAGQRPLQQAVAGERAGTTQRRRRPRRSASGPMAATILRR